MKRALSLQVEIESLGELRNCLPHTKNNKYKTVIILRGRPLIIGGLSYIIPKKGGLSYISRAEKRGSIELSLPVHLLYGSPPGSFETVNF